MKLESKLFLSPKFETKPEQFNYNLSGMGAKGTLQLTKGFDENDQYCIHLKCEGGIGKVTLFSFEGLSIWEKVSDKELRFVSFEEIERTKQIYKKWEFYDGHLQYVENKKGLIHEREVSYSVPKIAEENRIFDPLSVVAFFNFEKFEPNQIKTLFLLGKQQILQTEVKAVTKNKKTRLNLNPIAGVNAKWEKLLKEADIFLTEDGHIEEITAPTLLPFGKLHMQMQERKVTSQNEIDKILNSFTTQA